MLPETVTGLPVIAFVMFAKMLEVVESVLTPTLVTVPLPPPPPAFMK
jgi:hypothetical protein